MKLIYSILIIQLTLTSTALAYLDPGTLSMIFSVIAGVFASALIFIKDIINKIKKIFKKKEREKS
jgi:hypothetical protein